MNETTTLDVRGFSIGAAIPGFIAGSLIERFGWQSLFVIGVVVPCIIASISLVVVPESIRFLITKDRDRQQIARYLSRIAPEKGLDERTVFVSGEPQTQSGISG